ncbi:hypothetical protein U3516DRAFT_565114 [Neocallimastix sp. 'constans']
MIKFGKEEIKINKYNSKAELNTFNLGNECSYNKNISYMNLNTITDNFRNNNIINNNVNNNDFNSKIDDTSLNSFCVETHKIYIINNTKKIIYRTIIIYIIYVVVLFFIFLKNILSYKNEISNLIQDDSQNWRFNCNFENSDLILNLLYSVIFTFITFIGNAILKYDCIFVFIQYIIYSSIISAISSALIGVSSYIIFRNNYITKIFYELTINTIAYITLFLLLSWDKIYYIIKKKGNDPTVYFIYKRHELCLTHNSNRCGCKLTISKELLLNNIEQYINIYKKSSKFVLKEDK